MRHLIVIVLLLLVQIYATDEYSNSLCIEEKSVGLDWSDSHQEWEYAKVSPKQYIVSKIKAEKANGNIPKSGLCYYSLKNDMVLGERTLKYACYNIRESAAEYSPSKTEVCEEIWSKGGQLLSVGCSDMKFMPNGFFQMGRINNPMQWGSYKSIESIYKLPTSVSVGKCTQL